MWERLPAGDDFRAVFDRGRSVANGLAALYVRQRQGGVSRVAVAAGKRLGGAVVRNRHRRRWREVLRRHAELVPAGVDVVLVSRARAGTARFQDLERAVADLLARARVPRGS